MKNKIDISQLKEFLEKYVFPKELAKHLEDMNLQYARMSLKVAMRQSEDSVPVHSEADEHIYYVSELVRILKEIDNTN